MSSPLFFENKKFISSREAAKVAKYSIDYVGQLCRQGELECRRVGRSWYVCEESITAHKKGFAYSVVESKPGTSRIVSDKEKSTLLSSSPQTPADPIVADIQDSENKTVHQKSVANPPSISDGGVSGFSYDQDSSPLLPQLSQKSTKLVVKDDKPEIYKTVNDSDFQYPSFSPKSIVGPIKKGLYQFGGLAGSFAGSRKTVAILLAISLTLQSYIYISNPSSAETAMNVIRDIPQYLWAGLKDTNIEIDTRKIQEAGIALFNTATKEVYLFSENPAGYISDVASNSYRDLSSAVSGAYNQAYNGLVAVGNTTITASLAARNGISDSPRNLLGFFKSSLQLAREKIRDFFVGDIEVAQNQNTPNEVKEVAADSGSVGNTMTIVNKQPIVQNITENKTVAYTGVSQPVGK